MSILVRYGLNNQVTKELFECPTVSSVLGNAGLRQHLGFGDNVEARVGGMSGVESLKDGDTVDIQSRANSKG